MIKIFTQKKVCRLLAGVQKEYEAVVREQKERIERLTEENRDLAARVSLLEREKGLVAQALVDAEKASGEIRSSADEYARTQKAALYRLAERCRALADELSKAHPEEARESGYEKYVERLEEALETNGQGELDMDAILYPDENLKLENLCKEMGLMEDEE